MKVRWTSQAEQDRTDILTYIAADNVRAAIAMDELFGSAAAAHASDAAENAIAKARHAARSTGLPALADDSGLCVEALGGAPGVMSARFAGEPKSDQRNNALLLEKLAGQADRRARFYCALALVRHADDPQPLIACGEWHGEILDTPRGTAGFGYDPLFLVSELEQTAAEIPAELKNVLSHRGNAFRQLLDKLRAEPI